MSLLSWSKADEQWLRTEYPLVKGWDFSNVRTYASTEGATLFELTGECPTHKRQHKSNHWCMWVTADEDTKERRYRVGCFDETSSNSKKRSSEGPGKPKTKKTFSFTGWRGPVCKAFVSGEIYIYTGKGKWVVFPNEAALDSKARELIEQDKYTLFYDLYPETQQSGGKMMFSREGFLLSSAETQFRHAEPGEVVDFSTS